MNPIYFNTHFPVAYPYYKEYAAGFFTALGRMIHQGGK